MDKNFSEYGVKIVKPIKLSNKIQNASKSQISKPQSKFNKIYHDELKKRGICRNL